ncbi:MAG: hypothetical protein LBN74_07700 [Prevotella sp.]|jgi:peptidoglycan hydrolase CwlO-like protein|nr:hypothetical protein [Prevotella sp.]
MKGCCLFALTILSLTLLTSCNNYVSKQEYDDLVLEKRTLEDELEKVTQERDDLQEEVDDLQMKFDNCKSDLDDCETEKMMDW